MRRFLSVFLQFTLFAAVFYCGWVFLCGGAARGAWRGNVRHKIGNSGHLYTRVREVEQVGPVDVLFIGTSRCLRGFDPRIFAEYGISSFNLGSSSQTFQQTQVLLGRHLETLKPSLVVLEASPRALARAGVESALNVVATDTIDGAAMTMVFELGELRVFNGTLYAGMRQVLRLDADFDEPLEARGERYIPGTGFVETLALRDPDFIPADYSAVVPRSEQLEAMDEVVALLRTKGGPFVFVQAPLPKQPRDIQSKIDRANREFQRRGRFVNSNTWLEIDDELHFFDDTHLNRVGVDLFNRALIRELRRQQILPLARVHGAVSAPGKNIPGE